MLSCSLDLVNNYPCSSFMWITTNPKLLNIMRIVQLTYTRTASLYISSNRISLGENHSWIIMPRGKTYRYGYSSTPDKPSAWNWASEDGIKTLKLAAIDHCQTLTVSSIGCQYSVTAEFWTLNNQLFHSCLHKHSLVQITNNVPKHYPWHPILTETELNKPNVFYKFLEEKCI